MQYISIVLFKRKLYLSGHKPCRSAHWNKTHLGQTQLRCKSDHTAGRSDHSESGCCYTQSGDCCLLWHPLHDMRSLRWLAPMLLQQSLTGTVGRPWHRWLCMALGDRRRKDKGVSCCFIILYCTHIYTHIRRWDNLHFSNIFEYFFRKRLTEINISKVLWLWLHYTWYVSN